MLPFNSEWYYPRHPNGPFHTPSVFITGGEPGHQAPAAPARLIPSLDADAPARVVGSIFVMLGVYQVTWNLSGYALPPIDEGEGTGYVVRTILYVPDVDYLLPSHAYACPDAPRYEKARLARLHRPAYLAWEGGPVQTLTIPEPLRVISLRGEVRAYAPGPSSGNLLADPWSIYDATETQYGMYARENPPPDEE